MTTSPTVRAFTPAPLRNRTRIELRAPIAEVWSLLGDLVRFPEYASGLDRVEVTRDSSGACVEYVCHFKPIGPDEPSIVTREIIRWWEPGRGYASSGVQGDAFGLRNDLHVVTLDPGAGGTIVTWDEYFDAQDPDFMTAHFDEALVDAGENLIRRFGGRFIERYAEGSGHHAAGAADGRA